VLLVLGTGMFLVGRSIPRLSSSRVLRDIQQMFGWEGKYVVPSDVRSAVRIVATAAFVMCALLLILGLSSLGRAVFSQYNALHS